MGRCGGRRQRLCREMGKMILRCSSKMELGELGWWTLKARRDLLRLKFWGKIVSRMSSSRLVKQVYEHSRALYEAGQKQMVRIHTHAADRARHGGNMAARNG